MRSQKDVDKSNRLNETKAAILFLLRKSKKYLYIFEMAKELDMSKNNVARQMTKLINRVPKTRNGRPINYRPLKMRRGKIRKRGETAYIYRRKQRLNDKGHKGEFQYRFLTQKGKRVCKELWIRTKLREEIDPSLTFNLKKPVINPKYAKRKMELETEYNQWLLT